MQKNEAGSALVELVFCAVIIAIAVMFIGSYLVRFSVSSEISETGERARAFSDDALNALTSLPASQLPTESSFNLNGNALEITAPCSVNTCDYITLAPVYGLNLGSRDSIARGKLYDSSPLPDAFLRRWKVENVDNDLKLKKITVVILRDETSTTPLRIESTIQGFNR